MRASLDPSCGMGALPGWLSAITNKIVRGTIITIPGPAGPITFDLGDPNGTAKAQAAWNAALNAAKGARVTTTVSNRPPSIFEQVNQSVPGGWGTIALVGVGLAVAIPLIMRSRR